MPANADSGNDQQGKTMYQHKGNARRKLKSTQVQAMLKTIQKRITEDATLTADQLIQLTNAAVELAQTLNSMDAALLKQRKKKRAVDLFAKRGTDSI